MTLIAVPMRSSFARGCSKRARPTRARSPGLWARALPVDLRKSRERLEHLLATNATDLSQLVSLIALHLSGGRRALKLLSEARSRFEAEGAGEIHCGSKRRQRWLRRHALREFSDRYRFACGLTELDRTQDGRMVEFSDQAISGSTFFRPGYQKLPEGRREREFDVVVAEALDRLSRDQEHVAALYKQMTFAGIELFTVAEGPIKELHAGLKGTMNALFLKDLALKTHRGLRGRVGAGRHGTNEPNSDYESGPSLSAQGLSPHYAASPLTALT
jgi:Resolvase, N terminal domain